MLVTAVWVRPQCTCGGGSCTKIHEIYAWIISAMSLTLGVYAYLVAFGSLSSLIGVDSVSNYMPAVKFPACLDLGKKSLVSG